MSRLTGAMIAYVALAGLTWATIGDSRIRGATLLILGLFAVKSWPRRKDVLHPHDESEKKQNGELTADS